MAQTLLKQHSVKQESHVNKQRTVVLLRWVLIIAFSYLLLLDTSSGRPPTHLALLIAVALASNLVIARMPLQFVQSRSFDFSVVVFDAAWVTLGLAWAPNVSGDLFLLYFLVIFVAATGESLSMIVGSAALVSLVYGATLSLNPSGDLRLTTTSLLRVPFLFVVALFYGYFVGEIRTRRNETAEAQLRDNAKSELLAAVSHDLRGPLGNAENLLALVLDGDPSDIADNRVLLLRAQVNVRRLGSLVNNLLQTACIESGQLHLQWTPVQLNDIVGEVYNLETAAAVLKDVDLRMELCPQLPMFTGDFMQIGRIVTNLVNNAIKYTGAKGSVVIRTAYDDDTVQLSVQDSGTGMSAEQCSALFAPYRRVHLGGYTAGTGLGLYIVKRLVEAHNATVQVTSTRGEGSTFVAAFTRAPHVHATASRVSRIEAAVPAASNASRQQAAAPVAA